MCYRIFSVLLYAFFLLLSHLDARAQITASVKGHTNHRQYELAEHRNNILSVVSNIVQPMDNNTDGVLDEMLARVSQSNDYSGFGVVLKERSYSNKEYRYGFQGQEIDGEIKEAESSVNYTFRMHDARLGKFLSIDPLVHSYPWNSPYAFSENRVIDCVELEGAEAQNVIMPSDGLYHYGHALHEFKANWNTTLPEITISAKRFPAELDFIVSDDIDNHDWIFKNGYYLTAENSSGNPAMTEYKYLSHSTGNWVQFYPKSNAELKDIKMQNLLKVHEFFTEINVSLADGMITIGGNYKAFRRVFPKVVPKIAAHSNQIKQSLPEFVYRFDTRSPEQIKAAGGFYPQGDNMDLYRHTLGVDPNSGYVATSENYWAANSHGKIFGKGYIYEIRTPHNGINVNENLGIHSLMSDEVEIAIPGKLPFENIVNWEKIK